MYDKHYKKGGFGYDKNITTWKKWVKDHIVNSSKDKDNTLLDVGCGDGFWSVLLAPHFKDVKGSDISKGGIEVANKRKEKLQLKNVRFEDMDTLEEKDSFDVIFARSPSFLNENPNSEKFKKGLKKLISLCNKRIIFVTSTSTPYGPRGNNYFHDPQVIKKIFSKYGKAECKMGGAYLIATIDVKHKDE